MTIITDTAIVHLLERQDSTGDLREAQAYLDARKDAADAMLSSEPRVFGSTGLARLLGVTTRLQRESSC